MGTGRQIDAGRKFPNAYGRVEIGDGRSERNGPGIAIRADIGPSRRYLGDRWKARDLRQILDPLGHAHSSKSRICDLTAAGRPDWSWNAKAIAKESNDETGCVNRMIHCRAAAIACRASPGPLPGPGRCSDTTVLSVDSSVATFPGSRCRGVIRRSVSRAERSDYYGEIVETALPI